MSDNYFMGYKVNTNINYYLPNTVLFTKNDEKVTVAMAQNMVDYMLDVLALNNPLLENYNRAKTVFSAIKLLLENKRPPIVTKDDLNITIDVVKKIQDTYAKTNAEKEYNARCALLCKLLVNGFGENKI